MGCVPNVRLLLGMLRDIKMFDVVIPKMGSVKEPTGCFFNELVKIGSLSITVVVDIVMEFVKKPFTAS
jgi:hypothetical protein